MSLRRKLALSMSSSSRLGPLLPLITAVDRRLHSVTSGRFGLLSIAGLPSMTLRVPGRKSGISRNTPLLCVPVYDGWLVVGSNFGADVKPAWALNLEASAAAEVTFAGRVTTVSHRMLQGDERDQAWQRLIDVWPNFDLYQGKTSRPIPVYLLTPSSAA